MNLNYPLILFCLMVATGLVWLGDVAVFRRARRDGAERALRAFDLQVAGPRQSGERERLHDRLLRRPAWIEIPAGFFPIILVVFLARSFVAEPFRIPSGSMMPTLEVGDFILVNKFAYGLRLPLIDRQVVPLGSPRRGDIAVFRFPPNPSEDFVKRIVGLPGDTVVYRDKQLSINDRALPISGAATYFDGERNATVTRSSEILGSVVHDVLVDPRRRDLARPVAQFPFIGQCRYADDGSVTCIVPPGHYFVMGDNRDNSLDSRYWGFVPDENLVGRAMFVWMNFAHPGRIGGIR